MASFNLKKIFDQFFEQKMIRSVHGRFLSSFKIIAHFQEL